MKIALYGGGDDLDNRDLDREIIGQLPKNPKLTFIPSSSYESDLDFYYFVKQYKRFKVDRFIHFPIDVEYDSLFKKQAFSADLIHLGGGNTYYFINWVRKKGLKKDFERFLKRGGMLTGLSAGAIIMTPTIKTASFPRWDRDENYDKIMNLSGMQFTSFEFFPHYRNSIRYENVLINYSKRSKHPVYACPDGSGIFTSKDKLSFIGKTYLFYRGKKYQIR